MKLILGITGPSGSGKTQVTKLLDNMGVMVIDADKVGHKVTNREDVLNEIRTEFNDVILPDGTLDRKKLGKIVFGDKKKLELLNLITHRHIVKEISKMIDESDKEIIAIDAAVLKESKLNQLCSYIIAVIAPKEIRIERIMQRDNLSREDATKRVNSQRKDSEYAHEANFVILNSGDINQLNMRMLEIFKIIRGQ